MAYVCDIPLKAPQETFVDAPGSYEDVSKDELVFDLRHEIKDINKLHAFHAIAVLATVLRDIINLQEHPELFQEYRRQELAKYNLVSAGDLSIDLQVSNSNGSTISSSSSSSSSTEQLNGSHTDISEVRETSLPNYESTEAINEAQRTLKSSINPSEEEQHIIPIEQLIQDTCLNVTEQPILELSREKLQKELTFYEKSVSPNQISHLLKSFNLVKVPPITIDDFLIRIKTYSPSVSVSSYIHSAFMIYKLSILLNVVPLNAFNVYRFILALIRCLTKKFEDIYQKQKQFAIVGGVSSKDLCKIEIGFLYLCNFRIIAGEAFFNNFLQKDFVALRDFCSQHLDESKDAQLTDDCTDPIDIDAN